MVAVKVVELVVAAVKVVGDDRRWWVGANERSNGWSRQVTTAATTRNTTERGQQKSRNKHEVQLGDRASARCNGGGDGDGGGTRREGEEALKNEGAPTTTKKTTERATRAQEEEAQI